MAKTSVAKKPKRKKASQHSIGVSIALVAVVTTVIAWLVSPTFLARSIGLAVASLGLIYLCKTISWVNTWSTTQRNVCAVAVVAALLCVSLPQLRNQWTKEHNPPTEKPPEVCQTTIIMTGGEVFDNKIGMQNPPGVCVNIDGTIFDHNGVAIKNVSK